MLHIYRERRCLVVYIPRETVSGCIYTWIDSIWLYIYQERRYLVAYTWSDGIWLYIYLEKLYLVV